MAPSAPIRLHRHAAAMLALEQRIAEELDALSQRADDGAAGEELVSLLNALRQLTAGQRQALDARLQAVASGAQLPELAAPVSSFHRFEATDNFATATIFALHGLYGEAVLGYAVLFELANRAGDNGERLGPHNTAELARQHMRAYVAVLRDIIWMLPHLVIDEEERDRQECECICPSCGLGVCLCWLAFRRQLAMAWADTPPFDALAGIEMVRPRSGSAADRAGLQKGDVLVAIDGTEIESLPMLQEAIKGHPLGHEIAIEVQRATGEQNQVQLVRSAGPPSW